MKARAIRLAGWALLCLLLAQTFSAAARLSLAWPAIGIRLQQPADRSVCEQAAELASGTGAQVSFWAERSGAFSTPRAAAQATVVEFRGDGALAWPAVCLSGTLPAASDTGGCAVTAPLAWALWGSLDAVGQTLEENGRTYTVRGVLDSGETAAVLPGTEKTQYTAAEFLPAPGSDGGEQARSFAMSAGLAAKTMVYGPSLAAGCRLLAWLPLCAAAVWMAAHGLAAARRRWPAAGRLVPWALAFGLAAALPWLLNRLPVWLVPARWSDFGYWSRLAQTLREQLRALLAMSPSLRDVDAKAALLQCVLCGLGALAVCGMLAAAHTRRTPPE